jgi:sarcosine oxidase subunit alpha
LIRQDRKQLVGLLAVEPSELLPEGAQLVTVDADLSRVPVPMIGHVTSSYRSAVLGRTFALALVNRGRARIGEIVRAPLKGHVVDAAITSSVMFDPENRRRDGASDV